MKTIVDVFFNYFERIFCKFNNLLPEKGRILMFHNISDEDIDTMECCKCKVNRFIEIITELENNNYEFIPISDIDKKHRTKFAVISFDDIPYNVYANAYPYLKKHNIPFVIYISNSMIDKEGFITLEQLNIFSNDPLCTIGYHSQSHGFLHNCDNLSYEINDSKTELENIINKTINYFAYPYGKIEAIGLKSIRVAKKGDYYNAVGTYNTTITCLTKYMKFYLPRKIMM